MVTFLLFVGGLACIGLFLWNPDPSFEFEGKKDTTTHGIRVIYHANTFLAGLLLLDYAFLSMVGTFEPRAYDWLLPSYVLVGSILVMWGFAIFSSRRPNFIVVRALRWSAEPKKDRNYMAWSFILYGLAIVFVGIALMF